MSEMKNAVGAGTGRSGDDLCAGNSVREFKIWQMSETMEKRS